MTTSPCPYCNATLPQRGFFCPACAKQVKCKSCQALLEIDAKACIYCGELLGQGSPTERPLQTSGPKAPVNRLMYKETPKSVSFEAELTDGGTESLSGLIGYVVAGRQRMRKGGQGPLGEPVIINQTPLQLPNSSDLHLPVDSEIDESVPVAHQEPETILTEESNPVLGGDGEKISKVFIKRGNELELDDPRLKGQSQLDYARRLVFLFLYANEILLERSTVTRPELRKVLEEQAVYDSNTRTWLKKASELKRYDDESFGLNAAGREKAQSILGELSDPAFENKWTPDNSTRSRGNKITPSAASGEQGGASRERKPSKSKINVSEIVARWKRTRVSIDAHTILDGRSVLDKALFGLWAIRKCTDDEIKAVSVASLEKFLLDAFELETNSRSLGRALSNKEAKGRVISHGGTTYQITPPGVKYIDELTQ